jgi:arylformamidase
MTMCISKLVWLSYPMSVDDPTPAGIPKPELRRLYSAERDGSNVHLMTVSSHNGTHVDAPQHVFDSAASISDFAPEELVFVKPVVIDVTLPDADIVTPAHVEPWLAALSDADIALVRFGGGGIRQTDPDRFAARSPGFGPDAARLIRNRCPRLRAIGVDLPSVICIPRQAESARAHHEFLGSGRFLAVEDMDLDRDLSDLVEVRISPWMVTGFDSAPCSVVGVLRCQAD